MKNYNYVQSARWSLPFSSVHTERNALINFYRKKKKVSDKR